MKESQPAIDRLVTVAVDIQNDFCPGGALAVTNGDQVVDPTNKLMGYTRDNGGIVIATGDQHPALTPHFDTWPVHCVADTDGAALRDDLDIRDGDIIIAKGTGQTDGYSGFEGAASDGITIESLITPAEGEHVGVAITGLATDYCVLNTTLDALKIASEVRAARIGKITVFAVRDAMRAVNLQPNDGEKALEQMEAAGAMMVESIDILTERAFELAR